MKPCAGWMRWCLTVLSRTLTAEPASPANGDRYLLPDGATGEAWDGAGAGTLMAF